MTIPLAHRQPRKPDRRDAFEQECLTKIVHCLREMQMLHHQKRSGSLAYRIMETELTAWREALDLYRKISSISKEKVR